MSEPKPHEQIQDALNESRILVLGVQVLLGFQYETVFEPAFDQLAPLPINLILIALAFLLITFALLVAPTPYHLITWKGEDTQDLNTFVVRVVMLALFPFAFTLGIDFYVVIDRVEGTLVALIFAIVVTVAAVMCWYGIEVIHMKKHRADLHKGNPGKDSGDKDSGSKTGLEEKINHILTEARIILPGTQALLGFQFLAMLMQGFDKLPPLSKSIHLASLTVMAISIILLMTPPAYHRIVEKGEATEHFFSLASVMVLASMVPMGLGMCGDFYVVARQVTKSSSFSAATSIALLMFLFGLWFGLTTYRRRLKNPPPRHSSAASAEA